MDNKLDILIFAAHPDDAEIGMGPSISMDHSKRSAKKNSSLSAKSSLRLRNKKRKHRKNTRAISRVFFFIAHRRQPFLKN